MIILHDNAYYESRKPKPDLGPCRNLLRFIWNGKKKTILDRTLTEWCDVIIYYTFFFGVLSAIFCLQMYLTLHSIADLDKPLFKYESPLRRKVRSVSSSWPVVIFGSPGIAYKPHVQLPTSVPIIWINEKNTITRPKRYVEALSSFLQEYKRINSNYELECNNGEFRVYPNSKPCFFDIKSLGGCAEAPYGYMSMQPCVLITFNKKLGWTPVYYNQSSDLPENMPHSLKNLIRRSEKFYIWLSCNGVNGVDKDHIGNIEYSPVPGFPVEYFPFTGQQEYLSPMVAIQFRNLTLNRLITVHCAIWASNIKQHYNSHLDFQIIIEQ